MAVIFSYPVKSTPELTDKMLISDGTDNLTKQVTISGVKDTIDVVDSITATVPLLASSSSGDSTISISGLTGYGSAGQVMVMNAGGTALEWSTITGGNGLTIFNDGSGIGLNIGKLDFIGNGVSAAVDNNDNTKVNITIPGGGGTPATPLNSVQFNNNSAFGGSSNLTFATDTLRVTNTLDVRGDGTNAGKLKLYCENTSTPHAVTIEGPAHLNATAYTLKLPSAAPTSNQVLEYENSTNNLRWINTPSGSGSTSPASPLNSVQFNNNGSFGGSSKLKYTDSTRILSIGDQDVFGGVVDIAGGQTGGAGQLRLGDDGASGNYITLKGAGDVANAYNIVLPGSAPGGANKILESDASGNLSWIDTPTGTTYSAGTGLALNGTTFSLAAGAALTNLGGGTGTTFLRKDGTWVTPQDANTNIATTNLQLNNSRNLDLSNGDAADYALTFISTLGGASKNLFKFDQIGSTSPRFTVGHTESAYEGYVVLEGNGSNRTGILQLQNAAGTYYTSFQAPNTFGANQNIGYVLPNLQGVANSVLTNNGSGTLSWDGVTEEASWTPTSANANTISNASGKYTKIGNTVFASFTFTMSGSTSISLSGLPFSGVYTGANKGTSIISVNNCASVQGQIVGGQMVAATSFTFNAYTGSGSGLPTKLQTTTSSMYQTAGGTYSGIIIYQTS